MEGLGWGLSGQDGRLAYFFLVALAVAGGVLTGEMSGEPMGLDFDFVEIWSSQILRHKAGGWDAIIEKLRVGHFFLAGGGAGGSRIVMRPSTDLTSERSS